ncbi:MAG: type I methionyl aminopeptidase [Candidatus Sumerlaeaceae bacterium]|nr:type I methionyl aminopeptidase [Candidatus Sumerlaeaceae bacterium]
MLLPRKSVVLKSASELKRMRAGGAILKRVVDHVAGLVRPGVTTAELDEVAHRLILEAGATPACLGYHGFPASICTSVNAEIVHGIPSHRVLQEGDIVSIDCVLLYDGLYTDMAVTVPVGRISHEAQTLLRVTKESLQRAIKQARPGRYVGDISVAVQRHVEAHGFSVIREYAGHGVGHAVHEEPAVFNFGLPKRGPLLCPGLVLAIEPMVSVGNWKTRVLEDGWTVVTTDGSLSAHFEHTVAVTENGPLVLTA